MTLKDAKNTSMAGSEKVKVKYLGPKAEVSFDGTSKGHVFAAGKPVEVDKNTADALVATKSFEVVK